MNIPFLQKTSYRLLRVLPALLLLIGCAEPQTFDVLIKNGRITDGSGEASYIGDVGINADTIAAIGQLSDAKGLSEIDATGLVVAPGFINMLSWAPTSLIEDGKSQSDIRQGVTLEVFGEGWSVGPLNEAMKKQQQESQGLLSSCASPVVVLLLLVLLLSSCCWSC